MKERTGKIKIDDFSSLLISLFKQPGLMAGNKCRSNPKKMILNMMITIDD